MGTMTVGWKQGQETKIIYTIQYNITIQYNNITLLPSANTLIARGMFCGAKYTHHTFTPIIKHLITTANKHPGKKSFIDARVYIYNYSYAGYFGKCACKQTLKSPL